MDFLFWVKYVSIPALVAIVGALWHIQRQLTAIRIEVAKDYVNREMLREAEERLAKHLEAIEAKIDKWINRCAPAPQRD